MKILSKFGGVLLTVGVVASLTATDADIIYGSISDAHSGTYSNTSPVSEDIRTEQLGPGLTQAVNDSSTYKKYREPLDNLVTHFEGQGFDIQHLLVDSRFEIYERLTTTFTESAERVAPTLDNYKERLGYTDKKDKIRSFMTDHMEALVKAEETYDIPRYVIAAILGVESDYGRVVGRYNPFNAYVSMIAQEYRDEFALAQLEELMEFTSRHDIDVLELKSSYAGAVSYAQFIPYSLNRWFVGTDFYDMENNIASVANYLAHFKEITGTVEGAVYRYNPSDLYTGAVMDLAREAEELMDS